MPASGTAGYRLHPNGNERSGFQTARVLIGFRDDGTLDHPIAAIGFQPIPLFAGSSDLVDGSVPTFSVQGRVYYSIMENNLGGFPPPPPGGRPGGGVIHRRRSIPGDIPRGIAQIMKESASAMKTPLTRVLLGVVLCFHRDGENNGCPTE